MSKMTIKYELSTEGQKISLLTGGTGKREQEIELNEVIKDFIDIASVYNDGTAILNINYGTPSLKNLKIDETHETISFPGWGNNKLVTKYIVRDDSTTPYFDSPQTAQDLINWYKNNQLKYNQKKEELQKEAEQLNQNFETELNQIKLDAQKAWELYYSQLEVNKQKEEEKQQLEKLERENREQEKLNWINQYGSDYLKNAVNLGYDCQRQYVTERAGKEYPEFNVDFKNHVEWKDRSCPSEEVIDLVMELKNDDYTPLVVWAINGFEYDFEPQEAIVIENYLDKYTLVKFM